MIRKIFKQLREEFRGIEWTSKKLRDFGYLFSGLCVLVAVFTVWKHGPLLTPLAPLLVGAVVLALVARFHPLFLRSPYLVWMGLALLLGLVVGNAVLVLLFYVVIVPIGLLSRIGKKEKFGGVFRGGEPTYWKPREKALTRERMEQLF